MRDLMPANNYRIWNQKPERYILCPAYNFTVTRVFVALVRTAAFEFCSAILRKSIKARRDRPAIPNSVRTVFIHVKASDRTFGAFWFDKGS